MSNRRTADWQFPTPRQAKAEEMAQRLHASVAPPDPAPAEPIPDSYWDALLADPRARGRPPLPIEQRRLSEIPRHLLRVDCDKCLRAVEIQTADAIRLCGPHAIWKDVAMRLLEEGCTARTGNRDSDGCWPFFRA